MILRPLRAVLATAFASLIASAPCPAQIVISEIHFDPPDKTSASEFVEIYNASAETADLAGWVFTSGISFVFPPGAELPAGEFLVLAEDPAAFTAEFGFAPDLGPYTGRLSNDGERLALRDAAGTLIDEVDYGVAFPWPTASGGRGSSLELIHPSLDNDLGGSWRASGFDSASEPVPPMFFVPPQSDAWRYRKGTSNPPSDWRTISFNEDASWNDGEASIGYGDGDDATVLSDMSGSYTTVYFRHEFDIPNPADIPPSWKLRVYIDDGCVVWLNGQEVARLHAPGGALDYDSLGQNHEAGWEEVDLPAPASILVAGTNLLAVHGLNQSATSSDFSFDASILIPGTDPDSLGPPTPGLANSVLAANAPPQTRQVNHSPRQPLSSEEAVITAKVTDPDGVSAVDLAYQIVSPGDYVPSLLSHAHSVLLGDPERPHDPNPEYENPASWTSVAMHDNGVGDDETGGDSIYTATLPARSHRTLVRYRITVRDTAGAAATVPYADDPSRNFAYFVYDGVPPYTATVRSVQSRTPYVYDADVMTSLPVYHLLTLESDLTHCIAYDSSFHIPKSNENARDHFNWQGTFVYDGIVYDHIRYRLRQANDRYGGRGKRSFRFRFNKGYHLRARDRFGERYPTRWRTLNTGKMFDNKDVGNFGLTETMNAILWNMVGEAPFVHTFQLRVIDDSEELDQYFGDFFGIHLAFENYDSRFLDAHDLADGNLYKLKDQIFDGNRVKRHQGLDAVDNDADFQNIRNNLRPERSDSWLDEHVDYSRWYPYHTICEAIRHYDFRPADSHLKNRAWYFAPSEGQYGRLWTLPHDSDASWGPNWNSGVDYSKNAIFASPGKPAFKQEYRNFIRSFRDLIWTEEVIHELIDDLTAQVHDLSDADRDRYRSAPSAAGSQDFGPIETKVRDMKNFAFVGWTGSTGPDVPAGGRARHLDNLANAEGDSSRIPATPSIAYTGPGGFPLDALAFESDAFSDPQGAATFAGLEWRIGEVTDPGAPGFDPLAPKLYEWPAAWESGDVTDSFVLALPPILAEGRTYRVRCRVRDTTNRWSHWSSPIEFTAGPPLAALPEEAALRVTELMYNPAGGSDFEFIEFRNVSGAAIDLRDVILADGVRFDFGDSPIERLAPGDYIVVVRNLDAFALRYDTSEIDIAGEYDDRLDNGGEVVQVRLRNGRIITEFVYSDVWHPETDGAGPSLQVVDEGADYPDVLSVPDAWFASAAPAGTPGLPSSGEPPAGGFRVPGDGNADQSLDIADALWLLLALFDGAERTPPCEGALTEGGNVLVLDANADGAVNIADSLFILAYLFESGAPPGLGVGCVRVEGCSSVCAF